MTRAFSSLMKGLLRGRRLRVVLTTFRSASDMVPLLAAGELDVGGGSPSAGLYNAMLRDVKIRIVADKSYSPPGYGSLSLLIRRDLIDGGRFKGLADLKGMRIGLTAPGVVNAAMLHTALASVGLRYDDVQTVGLTFPDHPIALKNGAVDGAAPRSRLRRLQSRLAQRSSTSATTRFHPGHQLGCLMFSEALTGQKFELGVQFLRAYLKGVRLYNRALKDGGLAGETADEVVSILARYTAARNRNCFAASRRRDCTRMGVSMSQACSAISISIAARAGSKAT